MLFGRKKNLKLLPVSLSIISALSLYGPWSCFLVSLRSQRTILKELLTDSGILVEGKIISTEREIPFTDRKSISSIISYFYDNHGIGKLDYLNPLYEKLKAETDDEVKEKYHYYRDKNEQVPRRMLVREGFGFEFVNEYQTQNSLDYINVALKYNYNPVLEDISGYDRMIDCTDNILKKPVFDEGYSLYIRHDSNKVVFSKDTLSELFSIDLKLHTDAILKKIKNPVNGNQLGPEEMTVRDENDSLKYMIAFRNFNLTRKTENENFELSSSHFRLYYTIK